MHWLNFIPRIFKTKAAKLIEERDRLRADLDFAIRECRNLRQQLQVQKDLNANVTVASADEHSFAERYAYLRNNFSLHNITRGRDNTTLDGYSGMKFQWHISNWDYADPTPEQLDKRLDEQIERHKSILKDKTHERKSY